tara:strand:- start:554 stop:742 length:189 start_codon:yes stop_codon:yes gene_type:complete
MLYGINMSNVKKLNKMMDKIESVLDEIEAINNGAVVNPKTNKILRDENNNIIYYADKKNTSK